LQLWNRVYAIERFPNGRSMKTVSVQLPESILRTGRETEESISRESQFLLALKLFELGRLSSKEAAAMCGVNVVDFLLFAEKSVFPAKVESAAASVDPSAPLPAVKISIQPTVPGRLEERTLL
jgi:hypothetical protein